MLAWERREGESEKAFSAFQFYRDMGPERSHRTVAEAIYGVQAKYSIRTVHEWSRKFDWVDRVRALEARDEMIRRQAVEEHLESEAADLAKRRAALEREQVEIAELAAGQVKRMLQWTLVEQEIIKENERGEPVTVIFSPARWTKSTPLALHTLMRNALAGEIEQDQETGLAFNPEEMSEDELELHRRYLDQAKVVPVDQPEEDQEPRPPR